MSEPKECPFCGGDWEFNAYFSPDGLVVSCKDCGAIVDARIADNRPIEDALNKRIAELEYNAAYDAMSIHAIMSTLDIDDETHGVADDMYETAHNLAHKLRTRAEQLQKDFDDVCSQLSDYEHKMIELFDLALDYENSAERAERDSRIWEQNANYWNLRNEQAEAMVEKLIEAGDAIRCSRWQCRLDSSAPLDTWDALVAEWQEREK